MVPLAKIRPSDGYNPRSEFADEQMAELVASVKRHGIITPLTLAPDGDGRLHDHRRGAPLPGGEGRQAPRGARAGARADGEALTLAVAENVIRADLSPIEEARAYQRLADEHGGAAKVARSSARASGWSPSGSTSCDCPTRQELLAARRLPLACAPPLVRIAEREPLLADLTAAWLAERPHDAALFPADPGEFVDDVLRAEWRDDAASRSTRSPTA